MRIRYLKPDFFEDEEIAQLPFIHRLAFAGLWCLADKEGRLMDSPSKIKAHLFSSDLSKINQKINIDKILNDLTQKPFIIRYEVEKKRYIQILNFKKHQKPHPNERNSEIPEFQGDIKKSCNLIKFNLISRRNGDGNGDRNGDGEGGVRVNKTPLTQYLDFVFLTDKEFSSLVGKLGKTHTKTYIEKLNNYIGSKGKKYKSHYYTILNWANKDGARKPELEKRYPINPEGLKKVKALVRGIGVDK